MAGAHLVLSLLLSAAPELEEGRALFQRMEYERAAKKLAEARRAPSLTRDERREVADLLARAYAAREQLDETEAVYAELLASDPQAPAPTGVSPKIREAYLRAKQRLYATDYVRIEPLAQGPGWVELRIDDPWNKVAAVAVATPGKEQPVTVQAGRGRAEGITGPEYWVLARASDGQ